MSRFPLAVTLLALSADVVPAGDSQPKPVLMVIANQDFYHREYGTDAAETLLVTLCDGRDVSEIEIPIELAMNLVERGRFLGEWEGDPVFEIDMGHDSEEPAVVPFHRVINNTIYGS